MNRRHIFCSFLNKEAEGLESPPYPGPVGARIFNNISKEAWSMWITKQTMLINEHKLTLINPEHRAILEKAMLNYLFKEA